MEVETMQDIESAQEIVAIDEALLRKKIG